MGSCCSRKTLANCFSKDTCLGACVYKTIFSPAYAKILDNLYIGNYTAGEKVLQNKEPITHIISFIPTDDDLKLEYEEAKISYHEYLFPDSPDEDIIKHFFAIKPLIEEILINQEGKLLLHCSAGASRSVSLGLLILMEYYHYNFNQAYELIDDKRFVMINEGFYDRLKIYK